MNVGDTYIVKENGQEILYEVIDVGENYHKAKEVENTD